MKVDIKKTIMTMETTGARLDIQFEFDDQMNSIKFLSALNSWFEAIKENEEDLIKGHTTRHRC